MEYSQSSSKREIHSNTGLPENTKIFSNNPSKLIPKELEINQTKRRVRRHEIIMIRLKINKIEFKNTVEKSMKSKYGSLKR